MIFRTWTPVQISLVKEISIDPGMDTISVNYDYHSEMMKFAC